jgi:transcriptional regulator with XRE-family HTH domain
MEARMSDAQRTELSDFLRSRRARIDPQALGLPAGRRRRIVGLRREEVAESAGIGTDWYTRLEQGRDVRPSVATISAIARALQLDEAEAAHLHRLARTDRRPAFVRETVPPTLARIVAAYPQPAYVMGQRWDLLAWNQAITGLFGDFSRFAEPERNVLLYMLTDPGIRAMFGARWEPEARKMIGQFRSDYGAWAGDPAFEGLVGLLDDRSPEFRIWWRAHDVHAQHAGVERLLHPVHGEITAAYATFQPIDDKSLKLVLYVSVPADQAS